MADPSREEEQVTLLGEEGLMAGGQALKLGYAQLVYVGSDYFDFYTRDILSYQRGSERMS
jgi:hypothetical protein